MKPEPEPEQENLYAQLWHTLICDAYEVDLSKKDKDDEDMASVGKTFLNNLKNTISTKTHAIQEKIKRLEHVKNIHFVSDEAILVDEEEKHLIKLPELKIEGVQFFSALTITINPCIGKGSPSTKIITIPTYKCPLTDEDKLRNNVGLFFETAKSCSTYICNIVRDEYFEALKETSHSYGVPFSHKENNNNEYHLYAYAIGTDDKIFLKYIESSNDEKSMVALAKKSRTLTTCIQILSDSIIQVSKEKYKWFIHNTGYNHGLVGFYGDKSKGNFLALTFRDPNPVMANLMRSVHCIT